MHTFATPLESGIDANTNLPVFGFTIRETFICYPFLIDILTALKRR